MSGCRFVLLALLLGLWSHPAELSGQRNLDNERDVWEGSSLGVRLEMTEGFAIVDEVYEHVRDSSPFENGDVIQEIASVEFPAEDLTPLRELLKTIDPETELKCIIERDGEKQKLSVNTFRREFLDIQAIYRRLNRNKIIQDHLEETKRDNWFEDFTQRMSKSVRVSKTPRLAAEALNTIIDEIGVSHTAIIPASAGLGFGSKPVGGIGILLQRHDINDREAYFVIDMKPGGPGDKSELLIGDEILAVNGLRIAQSRRLDLSGHEARHRLYHLMAEEGEKLELEVLSSPFEDSRDISVVAEQELSTLEAFRNSARKIKSEGQEIGYFRFWNLMSMRVVSDFKFKVQGEFVNSDCIIMDLRGRGGIVPAVTSLSRTVAEMERPVVAIIDGLTRSAKEMLAYLIKKHENVVVVGTTTSGAVTGATFLRLPSGNSLMFPVASADSLGRYIDGEILEGVGVEPDEEFEFFIPYAAGTDRLLNVAIKRATQLAKQSDDIIRR